MKSVLAFLFIGTVALFSREAHAVKVRIAAATRLEGRIDKNTGSPNGVVVRGTLRDDVGSPVPNSHIEIVFYEAQGDAPATLPMPRRCPEAVSPGAHQPHFAPDEYVVDTDASGSFCIQTSLFAERGTMKLRFGGRGLYDGTAAEIPFDLSRPAVAMAFDPEPAIVSLDRPTYSVGVRVSAPGVSKNGWRVLLTDERGHALGGADVDPDGLARVEVRTDDLAGPGTGQLSATLEGASVAGPAISHAIERHARVELEPEDANPQGVPEDGIPIAVRASSSRGTVNSGAVEVGVGQRSVGAEVLRNGKTVVVATFGSAESRSIMAFLRYVPTAPWWEPGAARSITIGVRAPSSWRRAPLILLCLAVVAWMMRGFFPRLRPRAEREPATAKPAAGDVQLVRRHRTDEGWAGHVVDAHDGSAVAGATVEVLIPAFPGAREGASGVGLQTRTDEAGDFAISAATFGSGAVLRVSAPWHAPLERPLPPPSKVAIPLVARRRRLLERLVHWAGREWGPWPGAREPTPEQVALRAARWVDPADGEAQKRGDEVKAWARAVGDVTRAEPQAGQRPRRVTRTAGGPRAAPSDSNRRRAKGCAE
jgi:hypothetical protein